MEYEIKVSKEAEKDMLLAKYHYKVSGQDIEFDNDLITQLAYLKENPYLIQLYYKNIRKVPFKHFLYSVHFIVKDKTVYILRVLHQKQLQF